MERKSLRDILHPGGQDKLSQAWDKTEAAKDFTPLSKGEYVCRLTSGTLQNSRSKATPGYKLEFTVAEGPYAGRKLWHDCWLTPSALPHTKRDLLKLGINSVEQMNRPLPAVFLCKVKVTLRKDDDGIERNKVQSFEVIGIEKPEADAFAPRPATAAGGQPPDGTPSTATAAEELPEGAEPLGEADTSFNPESF